MIGNGREPLTILAKSGRGLHRDGAPVFSRRTPIIVALFNLLVVRRSVLGNSSPPLCSTTTQSQMERRKLRKLKIAHETYLWRREHMHLADYQYSTCMERVVIYLEGYRNSPLHLYFREEDNLILGIDVEKEKWCVGSGSQGIIWLYRHDSKCALPADEANSAERRPLIHINLSRPAVIAKLIEYFIKAEWKPKEGSKPVVIENALRLLETLELPQGN